MPDSFLHGKMFGYSVNGIYLADAGACFGNNPKQSFWYMTHGSGGGLFGVNEWVPNADELWSAT